MQNQFPANEVKIQGVFQLKQVTPTFQKQVLLIRAKDTRDQQWKDAELEIYIKPDLLTSVGINPGDTIVINGWIAFNFATNGMSFPRVVATSVIKVQQAQQTVSQQPQVNPNFNNPQQVQAPAAPTAQQNEAEGIPSIPQMPAAF